MLIHTATQGRFLQAIKAEKHTAFIAPSIPFCRLFHPYLAPRTLSLHNNRIAAAVIQYLKAFPTDGTSAARTVSTIPLHTKLHLALLIGTLHDFPKCPTFQYLLHRPLLVLLNDRSLHILFEVMELYLYPALLHRAGDSFCICVNLDF